MRPILARKSGQVKRYHQFRLLNEETVAEHSFNVVNLVLMLTSGEASKELIVYALTHDMGEYATGDIPAPVKRCMSEQVRTAVEVNEYAAAIEVHPNLPDLIDGVTVEEKFTLQVADKLDGLLKCREEIRMGNRDMRAVGDEYARYLGELMEKNGLYNEQINECLKLYHQVIL